MTSQKRWMKEPFCGLSHGIGAVLSVGALILLLVLAEGRLWHTVSFAVYGASLIFLYSASALYHAWHASPHMEARLQQLDHIGIYLLIAGTYMPVCLIGIKGAWGWGLLIAEYGIALFGILSTLFWRSAPRWLRVVLYAVMGWLVIIAVEPLKATVPPSALVWLLAGGIVYTLGTVIYATDKPHLWPGKFSAHDLWHLFVIGGSVCHFVFVLRLLALNP